MAAIARHIEHDRLRRAAPAGEAVAPATFEGHERFAAYAAHELRAPIGLQRALVEVTLADPDADAAALRPSIREQALV